MIYQPIEDYQIDRMTYMYNRILSQKNRTMSDIINGHVCVYASIGALCVKSWQWTGTKWRIHTIHRATGFKTITLTPSMAQRVI